MQIGNFNLNLSTNDLVKGGIVIGGAVCLISYISKKVRVYSKKAREKAEAYKIELEAYRTEQLASIDFKATHDLMNAASSNKESSDNALILNIELLRLKRLVELTDSKSDIKKYMEEIKEISDAYSNKDNLTIATLAIRYKEKKEKRALEEERNHQLRLIREKADAEEAADRRVINNVTKAIESASKVLMKPITDK